ncbi:MAG: hypothetical protein ACREE4_17890 [Stellaceae bacterium]
MANSTEHLMTFPVTGGIFGVDRLAAKMNALLNADQIGPWHIGQWIDFTHTVIRIEFGTAAAGQLARRACIELMS